MRDLGELMAYIEILNFQTKQELNTLMHNMLEAVDDSIMKNSLQHALSVLKTTTEEEILQIKRDLNDK